MQLHKGGLRNRQTGMQLHKAGLCSRQADSCTRTGATQTPT